MGPDGRIMKTGFDVSKWQGDIDWPKVTGDIFYLKATGGDGGLYTDPKFQRNAQNCPKPWGPYHFAGGSNSAANEAKCFCNVISKYSYRLPPVLDWEPTNYDPDKALRFVHEFARVVKDLTGRTITLYTGAYVPLRRDNSLLEYDLWLAAYTTRPPYCAPWGNDWSLWQWSSTGHCPGINGGVDSNQVQDDWFNKHLIVPLIPPLPTPPLPTPLPLDDIMYAEVVNGLGADWVVYFTDVLQGTQKIKTPLYKTWIPDQNARDMWTQDYKIPAGAINDRLIDNIHTLGSLPPHFVSKVDPDYDGLSDEG